MQFNFNEDYDLSSFSKKNKPKKRKRHKNKSNTGKIVLTVLCSVLALILAGLIGVLAYAKTMFNRVDRVDIGNQLSIESDAKKKYADYVNIALLGLDTRGKGYNDGRTDAIIILTLDSVHNKIKMTSIARDSYVEIKGRRSKDKITHAYMYGKDAESRAALAVDTINRNYGMDITDVVTINFYGFAEVIDSIGGVWIDVSNAERNVMNETYIPFIKEQGIKCEYVRKAGYQLLSGGQALAYSRNRYTGSDLERGSRQREVLAAMFDQVKTLNLTELAPLIGNVLENCTTSLSNKDMVKMATWALTEKPTIENLGLPDEACNAKGSTINGTWYYVYDLDIAKKKIHDFILEEGDYVDPRSLAASSVDS